MSRTFVAYAGIGVLIPRFKLFTSERGRCCSHAESAAPFCGECGKPMWKMIDAPISQFDCSGCPGVLAGIPVYDQYNEHYLVAPFLAIANGGVQAFSRTRILLLPDAVTMSARMLEERLEPLGLWNPAQFGLWCVAEVS